MGRLERRCEAHGRGGTRCRWEGKGITGKDESVPRRTRLAIRHHGALLSLLRRAHTKRDKEIEKRNNTLVWGAGVGRGRGQEEQRDWIFTRTRRRGRGKRRRARTQHVGLARDSACSRLSLR